MNKKIYLSLASIIALCLLLFLSGCGSSENREGGATTVSPVGDGKCVQCHSATTEALTGQTIVAQYQLSSPHNREGLGCESCHGSGAQHQGIGPIPYRAPDADRCASCHNGASLTAAATNANTTFADSLHASAQNATHQSATCQRCHTHEGALLSNIAGYTGDYGVISNVAYQQTVPFPQSGYSTFKCATCHEHGGGLRAVKARYNNLYNTVDTLNGTIVSWDPNNNRKVDQFDLCTSCHTYQTNSYSDAGTNKNMLLADGSAAITGTTSKTVTGRAGYHDTSWYRLIATTHYDNPLTGLGDYDPISKTDVVLTPGNIIEGYVLRLSGPNNQNPCFDCHGHEAKTGTRYGQTTTPTIYTDWAQSGHAGGILKAKYAAATAANADPINDSSTKKNYAMVQSTMISGASSADATSTVASTVPAHSTTDAAAAIQLTKATAAGDGWAHYQWERTLKADGTNDRGTCQRCHTSTGLSNYLSNPTTYDYKANDFSHLSGWVKATATAATVASPQQEVLYCWGCHSNAGTGALRNPGAVPIYATYQSAPITLPDSGKSNVCYACHGGSGNIMGSRSSRFMAHHGAAATVLFSKETKVGYQYTGVSYANPSYFTHDTIGMSTGEGPCVVCHMKSSNGHSFSAVTKNSAGAITAINTQAKCDTCHTGNYVMTVAKLEEESEGYQEAGTVLKAYVANTITNYLNLAITSANYNNTTSVPDGAYGAFQNAMLNTEEKGGFAHNRYYVKRLIFDSLDWMDNGVLAGTFIIDATTYPKAAAWFGAPAGTTGNYTATRP